MKEGKNEKVGIDLLKIVAAVLVVGIHTAPFSFNIWLDRGFGLVTCLAVPVFFIVSGYFMQVRVSKKSDYIYISLNYLKIGVIWSIIYLILHVLMKLKDTLLYNVVDVFSGHLWYVWASAFAVFMLLTFSELLKIKKKIVDITAIILFILGVLLSTYQPLIDKIFEKPVMTRNGLFYGFPLMWLGFRLAEKRIEDKMGKLLVLLCMGGIGLGVEAVICVLILKTSSTIMWFFQPICATCLVLLALNIKINLRENVGRMLRKISTTVYLVHYVFIYCFDAIGITKGPLLFLLVMISSGLFSIVLLLLQKKWKILCVLN